MKNNNDKELADIIAFKIATYLPQYALAYPMVVIAVPVSPATYKQRGFNQVARLSYHIARNLNADILPHSVIKKKVTKKQSLVAGNQREKNIQNAFYTSQPLSLKKYQTVILVDDVITTGATFKELAKLVKSCGAHKVVSIAIAH